MDRVKWNDFMEILSDDLDRSGVYLNAGFQNMVKDFITASDGVVGLEVTAQAVPDMSVYVKLGRLYQGGKQGGIDADSEALMIAAASPTYPRIDRVVAQYQEIEDLPETRNVMIDVVSRNIAQQTVKTRVSGTVTMQVLEGIPAASPVAVNVPDGWVALAKINVPANATAIQQSNIINEAPHIISLMNHNHDGASGGKKVSYKNLTDLPAFATKAQAEAGTDNTAHMNPVRTHDAIKKVINDNADLFALNILQRSKSYAVGDIAYASALPSWARLECVTSGTTDTIEPDFSTVSTGGYSYLMVMYCG